MKKISFFVMGWFLFLAASSPSGYAQPFTFDVKHDHLWGDCVGKLIIDQDGVEYDTENSKDRRRWVYHDLKRIEIASRKEIILFTYEDLKYRLGAEKQFEFKLQEGEITPDIYQILLSKATKPVLTRVSYSSTSFLFTLPVKHRHVLGGCQGELKVGEDRVVYETKDPEDSRIWFYKDIGGIGLMDAYSFRLSAFGENYTFDLKVPISNQQYEFLWARVYQLENLYSENAQPRLPGITGSVLPKDSGGTHEQQGHYGCKFFQHVSLLIDRCLCLGGVETLSSPRRNLSISISSSPVCILPALESGHLKKRVRYWASAVRSRCSILRGASKPSINR